MKYFTTVLLALICLSTFAQVTKLRCYSTVLSRWEADHYQNVDENKTNFLIVIDQRIAKISIYASEETSYDIVKIDRQWVDDRGVAWINFQAVDDDGIKRTVSFAADKIRNYYTIGIAKGDYLLMYNMKRNE